VAALFGINGNRARVALSRMVASGEATADGAGGYRLAGHLVDRQRRQAASRAGSTRRWTGGWHLVVVTTAGSNAEVRNRRRRALSFARLAELREGTWLRPDNVDLAISADVAADLVVFTARSPFAGGSPAATGPAAAPAAAASAAMDDRRLAEQLWDLVGWAGQAEELRDRLDRLPPTDWTDLAAGFELSAAVLRHFQADPLLPADLLPDDWPGARLRRTYDGWDRRYRSVLATWTRRGP